MNHEKVYQKRLLKDIIDIEYKMFMNVKTNGPCFCKETPETFKTMRIVTHYTHSIETLESYLKDLGNALIDGRNLMTEKYARMQNQILPLKNESSLKIVDEIVEIEKIWMQELIEKYPSIFKKGLIGFSIYLPCELETYSDKTLGLYLKEIIKAKEEGRNLAEEQYDFLFKKIGYSSITDFEDKSKKNILVKNE